MALARAGTGGGTAPGAADASGTAVSLRAIAWPLQNWQLRDTIVGSEKSRFGWRQVIWPQLQQEGYTSQQQVAAQLGTMGWSRDRITAAFGYKPSWLDNIFRQLGQGVILLPSGSVAAGVAGGGGGAAAGGAAGGAAAGAAGSTVASTVAGDAGKLLTGEALVGVFNQAVGDLKYGALLLVAVVAGAYLLVHALTGQARPSDQGSRIIEMGKRAAK